jgi:hypothetical protein
VGKTLVMKKNLKTNQENANTAKLVILWCAQIVSVGQQQTNQQISAKTVVVATTKNVRGQ